MSHTPTFAKSDFPHVSDWPENWTQFSVETEIVGPVRPIKIPFLGPIIDGAFRAEKVARVRVRVKAGRSVT